MESIEQQHSVSSNFTPQARIVQSQDLLLANTRKESQEEGSGTTAIQRKVQACKEPLEILYRALVETLKQVSIEDVPDGFQPADVASLDYKVSLHPFLDKVYFQICKKSMYALELEQAQRFLDLVLQSRERVYGQSSESLLKPCESMVQCLRLQGAHGAAFATIQACLDIVVKVLGEPVDTVPDDADPNEEKEEDGEQPCPVKHPSKLLTVHQTRVEVLYMKQRLTFDVKKDYPEALDICDEMVAHQRAILKMPCTDVKAEASELAQLLFLKGQAMERMGLPKGEILKVQEETVALEESAQEEGKPKSEKLAKLYKVKAALLEYEGRTEEAKDCFAKAVEIYRENGQQAQADQLQGHASEIDRVDQEALARAFEGPKLAKEDSDDEEDDELEEPAVSKATLGLVGGLLAAMSVYALYRAQR